MTLYTAGMINILHGVGLRLLALGHHTPFMVRSLRRVILCNPIQAILLLDSRTLGCRIHTGVWQTRDRRCATRGTRLRSAICPPRWVLSPLYLLAAEMSRRQASLVFLVFLFIHTKELG